MEKRMGREYTFVPMGTNTKDNTKMVSGMERGFTIVRMGIDMKVSSRIHLSMEWELKGSVMEKLMLETMKGTDRMEKESITGAMETITEETSVTG